MELTSDLIRHYFDYNPETGDLVYRVSKTGNGVLGRVAGTVNARGYRVVKVDGKTYRSHRLIWLWMTGSWPTHHIDHINGDPLDNRWVNLRAATRSQNMRNRKVSKNNKLGLKGVSMFQGKFAATIYLNGRNKLLGRFETAEEAAEAYRKAADLYYQEFAKY